MSIKIQWNQKAIYSDGESHEKGSVILLILWMWAPSKKLFTWNPLLRFYKITKVEDCFNEVIQSLGPSGDEVM